MFTYQSLNESTLSCPDMVVEYGYMFETPVILHNKCCTNNIIDNIMNYITKYITIQVMLRTTDNITKQIVDWIRTTYNSLDK